MARVWTRRAVLRGGAGLVLAAAGGLLLPGTVAAAGLCPVCGVAPFGPLHAHLYAVGPDPVWMDRVIARESSWRSDSTNPYSGAAGLCQFMPATVEYGAELFGLYGSPYDPYFAIDLMSAFVSAGQRYHWACNGEWGCQDV